MQRAARIRIALVVLAVSSMVAKSAYASFYPQGDNARMARDIAAVYRAHGFAVSIEDRGELPPIVTARRGECIVMTRDSSYMPGAEVNNQQRMATAGPIAHNFRGGYVADQRNVLLEIYMLLKREQARFGIPVEVEPLLAVASLPACRPPARWFSALRFRIG